MAVGVIGVGVMGTPTAVAGESASQVIKVGSPPLTMTMRQEVEGTLSIVEAECTIPATPPAVWSVLSDYQHLSELVPFVTESRLLGEEGGAKMLYQAGRGGVWFFQRRFTVVFRIHEVPMHAITFQAVRGDFRRFEGSWQLEVRPEGTVVRHRVAIEPAFYVPRWSMRLIARHLMLKSFEGIVGRCADVRGQP